MVKVLDVEADERASLLVHQRSTLIERATQRLRLAVEGGRQALGDEEELHLGCPGSIVVNVQLLDRRDLVVGHDAGWGPRLDRVGQRRGSWDRAKGGLRSLSYKRVPTGKLA